MKFKEEIERLRKYTGMIVPKETYDCVTSYMLGMEKVLENSYLHLFTNWLIHKYNAPSEFDFYGQVKFLYNKRNKNKIISDEQNLIKFWWCFKKYDTTLDVPIIDIKES